MTPDGDPNAIPLRPEASWELRDIGGGLLYRAGRVASALDSAWELYGQGVFPELSTLVAESQSAGRGRFGRYWISEPGHVYASIRLPLAPPFDGSAAPIALALFVSQALEDVAGLATEIKWPNDILLSGRKTGGILLENRRGALMAGIGLNVGVPQLPTEARDDAAPVPGALPAFALPVEGPFGLWKEIAKNLILRYNGNSALLKPGQGDTPPAASGPDEGTLRPGLGFAELIGDATSRLYGLGRPVRVERPAPQNSEGEAFLEGILAGLDESGALLVETPDGFRALWSGTLLFPED